LGKRVVRFAQDDKFWTGLLWWRSQRFVRSSRAGEWKDCALCETSKLFGGANEKQVLRFAQDDSSLLVLGLLP
jgi:hypothetical protein